MEVDESIKDLYDDQNISSNIKDEILDNKKVIFLDNDIREKQHIFKIGDKVEGRFKEAMHKWQPGIIVDITPEGEYYVEYHDGDSCRYVSSENIRLIEEKSFTFKIGDKVEAKYKGKGKWFPGIIIEKGRISGKYIIEYDDGDIEKDVLHENIRLIEEKTLAFKIGDRVEANYKGNGKWFPGIIINIDYKRKYYRIDYDNGMYERVVLESNVRLLDSNYTEDYSNNIYKVGDKVEARFGRRSRWYPGRISRAHNNEYSIEYDDGEYETFVSEEFIRFLIPKDFPITEITQVDDAINTKAVESHRALLVNRREVPKVAAISGVAYNYSVENRNIPVSFTMVTPPPDDDISSIDPSGNLVDVSGNKIKKRYKKFTYKEIQNEIGANYFDTKTSFSSSLDIIGTYLRGQKLIYMESKSYCENKLNKLMMPAIFLSTAATVLSSIVKDFFWGAYLIAGVNGIIAFLLAVVNYLKLDAASEAHKITAHQYDKLQTKIEFLSGQTLLFDSSADVIKKELDEVKKKIEEIKETNQFIVPKKIRTLYPIMFNTNVFLIIKKIDDITKKKINAIKDLKNEKNYLIEVLKAKREAGKDNKIIKEIEMRITECQKEKNRNENNIVILKSAFSVIDEMFMKEMENAEKYKSMRFRRWFLCGLGVKENIIDPRQLNRFIEDIMNPYRDKEEEPVVKYENSDVDQLVNDLIQTKKVLKTKRQDELKRREKTIKGLKKANLLLKENIGITQEIYNKMEVYDKLERGEYDKINYEKDEKIIKLKKPKTIVKLLGIGNDEENINLKIHSDEEKGSISGSDKSDPFVDYDVCKKDYEI